MNTNPAIVRALYIILVPVVLLIILLNSGWMQKLLPAASMNGKSYNVVTYNFYYFDYYNSFLEENQYILDEIGYDPSVSDAKQMYSAGVTWREHLLEMSEANMSETAYFYDLAVADGYEFSDLELAPIDEKMAEIDAFRETNGLSAKNYYIAYYGSGMTEDRFKEEYTKKIKAQAYKQYLISTYEIPDTEIDAYLVENPIADYQAANIHVITIDGLADRQTGLYGSAQCEALTKKVQELTERYAAGTSFEELRQAFSSYRLGGALGIVENITRVDVEAGLATALFDSGKWSKTGDYGYYVSESNDIAYFIVYDGAGTNGAWQEARTVLARNKVAEDLENAKTANYAIHRKKLGMTLASK